MSEKQPKKQEGQNQTPQRKDGMPYRPLSIPERDFLFALYDKHGGNMLAMTRDSQCLFKSYNQLWFYCRFYGFKDRLAEIRTRRAEEIIAQLGDAKAETIARAVEMMRPRQRALKYRDEEGNLLTVMDKDGNAVFETIYPKDKEIKTAWEIIKTELGEPTTISKAEVNNPQSEEVTKALDVIARLSHGKPPSDGGALPSEREPAGDTPEVPAPVQHDLHEKPSA